MSRKKCPPGAPQRVEIETLREDGRGEAHVHGKPVRIDGALPGEIISMRYTRLRRDYDEGVVEEVLARSSERVDPRCAHFGYCGGCTLQHLSAAAQIAAKQAHLLDRLRQTAGVVPGAVAAPITAPVWGYRRKARLGVKWLGAKNLALVGFRELRTSKVAILESCETLHASVGKRLGMLHRLIASLDARERVPQIEVAVSDTATALVFRHLDALGGEDLERLRLFARTECIQVFLQPGGPGTVHPLWPETPPALSYALPGQCLTMEFGTLDFTQVNAAINQALVTRVLDWLAPERADTVLDLFCGIGNFSLPAARLADRVVGLEGSNALVARATRNARRNGLHNAEFHAADLAREEECRTWLGERAYKLLLDPPRSGAQAVVRNLPRCAPRRIVYVSCSARTLSDDAAVLVGEQGFHLAQTAVVDMFPHTSHVESINLFQR